MFSNVKMCIIETVEILNTILNFSSASGSPSEIIDAQAYQ